MERRTRSLTQPSRFSITAAENSRPYLCISMSRSMCNSVGGSRDLAWQHKLRRGDRSCARVVCLK